MPAHTLFATCPKGIEPLLADELRSLGGTDIREARAGVSFTGTLTAAYRICLWSRLASRVLLNLAEFSAHDGDSLYDAARAIRWDEHLAPDGTLAVDATVSDSGIVHSNFAAVRVKDAVADHFRERCGVRPSVATNRPDIRLNLRLHRNHGVLSLDLSGESLHRRGYREDGAAAPLKENLAAALLLYARYPEIAAAGGPLLDPMCGSGTLVIEGALMAADAAPGLLRDYFGFFGWKGHDASAWATLVAEARDRRAAGLASMPSIAGYDADPLAVAAATENVRRAGVESIVTIGRRDVARLEQPHGENAGLLIVNPPYGERLGTVQELKPLYALLGDRLREHFRGWKAAVFTGNPDLVREVGLRSRRTRTLYNGALECRLFHFEIDPKLFFREKTEARDEPAPLTPGGEMFANRLKKNLASLGKWARDNGIACYRLYDADMPEYAVAVDVYAADVTPGAPRWIHVQEYEAPKTIDEAKARARLREAMAAIPAALGVPREAIFLKVRRKGKGGARYGKMDRQGIFHEVAEGNCRFLANFTDYLDTGLFLDHRDTRRLVGSLAAGKTFLNLFAYTGTATVHAARGGAAATVTVDMSKTYLDWARRNMALNGFSDSRHEFVQADCLGWLSRKHNRQFDLIFLDPPTFSNSKRMDEASFDIQRDHVALLRNAAALLAPGGTLIFSNNNRRFRMQADLLPDLEIEDITPRTIPRDFARNPKIHNCWRIIRKDSRPAARG